MYSIKLPLLFAECPPYWKSFVNEVRGITYDPTEVYDNISQGLIKYGGSYIPSFSYGTGKFELPNAELMFETEEQFMWFVLVHSK